MIQANGYNQSHRSGEWDENVTPLRRDSYEQLIELRVTNGSLTMTHASGLLKAFMASASTTTQGAATFRGAVGDLRSATSLYRLAGDDLRLTGRIEQTLRPHPGDPSLMESTIRAEAVDGNLPPGIALPAPSAGPGHGLAFLLVGAALGGGLAFGGWRAAPRVREHRWNRLLRRAEVATNLGPATEALATTDRLVRRRPASGVAWAMWATARLHEDGAGAILDPLQQVEAHVDRPAHVQFVLAVAHLELGNTEACREYMRRLSADREFVRGLEETSGQSLSSLVPPAAPRDQPAYA